MRNLTIIFFLTALGCYGQTNASLKGKPKTLEDTFVYLDQMIDDTTAYNFMIFPEDIVVSRLRFPFGMWIRNDWGFWKESDLKRYFEKQGVYHPEAMTSIIFTSYYRYLHSDSIDLKGQVERLHRINSSVQVDTLENGTVQISYPELEKEVRTTTEELLNYYPIGDTVLVTLSGKKGLFNKYVSFKGMARITGYTEKKLLLTLIELKKEEKVKADYKIGEEIDAWTASCTLLPPQNWKK